MIDLHSHLLPGVDDGSRSVARSVSILRELVALGVTDVCLTPHLTASQIGDGVPAGHDRAFEALTAAAPEGITLHRGAEVMLDRPLPPSAASNRSVTLARSTYLLVEFPRMVASETVERALRMVAELGLRPLLAHPERYTSCSVSAARRWRATGSALQVDANTLLHRSTRGERARALLAAGMADILAADNHGDDRSLAAARDALLFEGAAAQAALLTVGNPRAILDDQPLTMVEPVTLRLPWMQRIRRLFDTGET
ncbi:MAG: CpsB/CapC family capsule biosynthesis tyrosine phosphatase [Gemmatimonadota bacterium]